MTVSFRQRVFKTAVFTLLVFLGARLFGNGRTAAAPANGCSFPVNAASEADLNDAIDCFTAQTIPGTYIITLTAEIPLSASTHVIDSAVAAAHLLIDGAGFTVDGQDISGIRPFAIAATTTVALQNVVVSGGSIGTGGGILNSGALALSASTVSGNTADGGGGIYNDGELTVDRSTFAANSGFFGGAIFNVGGTVTVSNSTFSGNAGGYGGGIFASGGSTAVSNSTFFGNSGGFDGGGVYVDGIMTLNNSIIAGSTTGGDCVVSGGTVNASNSLIAGGLGCVNGTNTANLSGNPFLSALQDNGGPTLTHALLPYSLGLDAGNNSLALDTDGSTLLTSDQRGSGFVRVANGTVDMGAYELDCAFPQTAATAGQFNTAVECYNAITAPGSYTIELSADILLSASTPVIVNATVGADLLVDGAGHTVDTQDLSGVRAFYIDTNTTATLANLAITGGNIDPGGGTVFNDGTLAVNSSALFGNFSNFGGAVTNVGTMIVSDSNLFDNDSPFGGAIANFGTLAVSNSTISANAASTSGGAIFNKKEIPSGYIGALTINDSTMSGNSATNWGGAIYNTSGETTLNNSTLSGNSATNGGGIYSHGSLLLSNSTLSGNSASNIGGGIYSYGTAFLGNSTLSGNSASSGGGIITTDGTVTLENSVIANSTSGNDCVNSGGQLQATNSLLEANLNCDIGPSSTNKTGDPALGPLQANGGPTLTHMPAGVSIVVGAGDNATCEAVDQRGVPRPQGSDCDMGAVEQTGQAALSGIVALQGRTQPGTAETVTLSDAAAIMPDAVVFFSGLTGAFSFDSVPVAAGGTSYDVTAVHSLYLANQLAGQATAANDNLDLGTTTLRGGDANNDGSINILDLGCMGGAYNTPDSSCGGAGGTDINADGITNIQDLGIAGGNYNLTAPRPWVPVP